jgi:LCP family protein required for cell wall assembly
MSIPATAGAPVSAGSAAPSRVTEAARAAGRVKLRRALTLLAMTVVAPGSAQLAAGNKRVGRIAMRVLFVVVGLGAALLMVALFWRSELVSLLTNLTVLALMRFAFIGLALGWAYLIIDAWRLANPLGLAQRPRLAMTVLNGVACFSLAGSLLYASHLVATQRDFIATVFGSGPAVAAQHGRYNVLLLGGDAGPKRVGLRPDSITVASIDADTGRTVLIGLPRNLAKVPFPDGSPMHRAFPNGFSCDGCYLNAVNTWAMDHKNLFPHARNPGIVATTQAVEAVTGLTMNYYALIDMKGFVDLVNAVGGVTIDVHDRIPIGGVGGPISGWIDPGRQRLDGYKTLWYARSRATSDDYSRMARQKCVMNAMLRQLDPRTVLTKFSAIANAGKQIISTSIPASEAGDFVNLALKARSLPVSTVSIVPPRINTSDPDFAKIRTMVSDAITKSEAKDSGGGAGGSGGRHHGHGTTSSERANDSQNLSNAC